MRLRTSACAEVKYGVLPSYEGFLAESLGVPPAINAAARAVAAAVWPELEEYRDRAATGARLGVDVSVPLKWWGSDRRFPIQRVDVRLESAIIPVLRRDWRREYFNGAFRGLRPARDSDGRVVDMSLTLLLYEGEPAAKGWLTPELRASLVDTAQHELLHAHEARMRELAGAARIQISAAGVADIGGILPPQLWEDPGIGSLVNAMYHSAPYEVAARVAQAAAILDDAQPGRRLDALRNSSEWGIAKELAGFDASAIWNGLVNRYGSDLAEAYVNAIRGMLLNRAAGVAEYLLDHLPRGAAQRFVSYVPDHVRKVAKKSPRDFLLYWQGVARKAGEDNRRRLLRLLARYD